MFTFRCVLAGACVRDYHGVSLRVELQMLQLVDVESSRKLQSLTACSRSFCSCRYLFFQGLGGGSCAKEDEVLVKVR